MDLTASLKNFLKNEDEQNLLRLFGCRFVLTNKQTALLCDHDLKQDLKFEIHPKNINISTDNFLCILQKSAHYDDYISYLENRRKNTTITLRRFIDEGPRENLVISLKNSYDEWDASYLREWDDYIESSLHVSPHHVLIEAHLLESQVSLFSSSYIRLKNYRIGQEGKMRKILRPFYQTQRELMEYLEKQYPELEEIGKNLLPHRFEDFAGVPWMKIYK